MTMLRFSLCFSCNHVVISGVTLVEISCFLELDNRERHFRFEYETIPLKHLKYFVSGAFSECFSSWSMSSADVTGATGG